jgi:hypothetical protein
MKDFIFTPFLRPSPSRDAGAMHEWPILVISSGARDLAFSPICEKRFLAFGSK